MNRRAMAIRILVTIICIIIIIAGILNFPMLAARGTLAVLVVLAPPMMIAWFMFDGIREMIKRDKSNSRGKQSTPQPTAKPAPELTQHDNVPIQEYRRGLLEAAASLSDHNLKARQYIEEYQQDGDHEQYRELQEELGIEPRLFDVFLEALIEQGFVGQNDWKFSLDDYLYNSEKAFLYYGIDLHIYDEIADKAHICAPEAFQIIKEHLPEGFGVGLIDDDSDTYYLVIARKSDLQKSEVIMKGIGHKLTII